MELVCTPDITLRSLCPTDSAALLAALDADRATFDRWLRWSSDVVTLEAATAFIARAASAEQEGRGFHLGLWKGELLLGGIPCWSIDPLHRVAELGYWLSAAARGSGLATSAARAVTELLFVERHINRVEFQCRVENASSRRVAERVGGRLEGIRRQSHRVGGAFRDHAVYAVLAEEWQQASAMSHLELIALVVKAYDPAIDFFVNILQFELVEDVPSLTNAGRPKRWVVVRPPGGVTGILLAQADGEQQAQVAGNQFAGRVGFFLRVGDFDGAYDRMVAAGVSFVSAPRVEPYGKVAVFLDLEGNRWDLLGGARPADGTR